MQYVIGYSDAQITMNIYNHIAEMSHVENEMSKMNHSCFGINISSCRKNVVKLRKMGG